MISEAQKPLAEFKPKHDYFVGIDSDGCAFDTMELKHKECFIPNIVKHWELQAVSKYAREAAEFVNLYSKWRGINRFPALVKVFDLLRERPDVQRRNVTIPDVPALRKFIDSGVPLGNPALKEAVQKTGDPILKQALVWSEAVNATIADMVHGVPPFPFVRESLQKLSEQADVIVVSATPGEALQREWKEHGIDAFVSIIAGQEMGSKKEHLRLATAGKYPPGHVLMLGDAPGDRRAAKANGVMFYPINPGHEEASWERFYNEVLDLFLEGNYTPEVEEKFNREFDTYLPENPPWKVTST
ncbi:MAG: HAD family hydrolase [Calditrichaeota bacterium]|nr:HAD family hydrolase [Calditrichota bacterium]